MTTDTENIVLNPLSASDVPQIANIELLFFAYRDFTADADRMLKRIGFGRAHHRALYFVNRNPGMTVAELISILDITKQSLSRVLRQLIDSDYIRQVEGDEDRRQRLLYPTFKGRELILELSAPQSRRIDKAMKNLELNDKSIISRFMKEMMNQPGQTTKFK
ncbi:MAG: MarR family winged helix-turn-helix transcriptional regulator [Rhizobiaceae bacterium]